MRKRECPFCRTRFVATVETERFAPFCSRRCKDADLARWFGEEYRVPVETERVAREVPPETAEDEHA